MREVLLDSKLTFSKPQDRLFAGQIDRMDRFALRFRARKYQSEQYRLPFAGLRGMRASLIPHQLHIAHEVGQRHAPRVLLADEVGLGKTIEAGMIIHQQLLAGRAERVLIVVPETLQHQWLVEMMRRFNLYFSLFDDSRYAEAKLDSSNPFETEQLVICSLDFVRRNKQRTEELADAQWDLLVVDEAHHRLERRSAEPRISGDRTAGRAYPRRAAADRHPGAAGPTEPLRAPAPARSEPFPRLRRFRRRAAEIPPGGRRRHPAAER